jgi:DNA-binding response OmpR family regulator
MARARILVAEDEPSIAQSLDFILRRADFDVDLVGDGALALDMMKRRSYGAVILDIMLPGMNGFDVLRAVRAEERLAALPIVVLTAKGQANDRKTAEAIGASAFITKPFSNAEIVERIRELTA